MSVSLVTETFFFPLTVRTSSEDRLNMSLLLFITEKLDGFPGNERNPQTGFRNAMFVLLHKTGVMGKNNLT